MQLSQSQRQLSESQNQVDQLTKDLMEEKAVTENAKVNNLMELASSILQNAILG